MQFFTTHRVLKKPPFLKTLYPCLHWMIYTSIACPLKSLIEVFQLFIRCSKCPLHSLTTRFTRIFMFCTHFATCLRLKLELLIEFMFLDCLWSVNYHDKQHLSIFIAESSRTGLNLLRVNQEIGPSLPIYRHKIFLSKYCLTCLA